MIYSAFLWQWSGFAGFSISFRLLNRREIKSCKLTSRTPHRKTIHREDFQQVHPFRCDRSSSYSVSIRRNCRANDFRLRAFAAQA